MFFEFRFWKGLFDQPTLLQSLGDTTMRGFKKRVAVVFALGFILFILRELWGMNTENLTGTLGEGFIVQYIAARWLSLLLMVIWALLYMAFHFFGVSYFFHKVTAIDLQKVAVMQLFVLSLLLIEKTFDFVIFIWQGYTTNVSLFSFGPLAATITDHPFVVFFFNQLSIFTALIIGIQYRFIRAYANIPARAILAIIIGLHLLFAVIVGAIAITPYDEWIHSLLNGGDGQ